MTRPVVSQLAAGGIAALLIATVNAAPTCYNLGYGGVPAAKPNKLYLYIPTVDDATFPNFGIGTSPLRAFDVSLLTNYSGTVAALRDKIFDVVVDDYCEFNVEVMQTTTAPPTTAARRNIVGIGTDNSGGGPFGLAETVDTGDETVIDRSRVWAGAYQTNYGGVGQALEGANSTLARWANAIGGTAAHEAGHNYGLAHTTVVVTGEDAFTRHVMPAGSNLNGEHRAGYRRHFSNREYEILAANVGLSVQTMWNWDLVNPNAQTARTLRMTFLSGQTSLSVLAPYTGNLSPWGAPTVSASLGTQIYKGTAYNRYQVTWSSPQNWAGPTPGEVTGGASFHVGTSFSGVNFNVADAIIITDVDLLDSTGIALALHPRIIGFDNGVADAADGTFSVQAINLRSEPLIVSDVRVVFLPRLLSINAMLSKVEKLFDVFGDANSPWTKTNVEWKTMPVTEKEPAKIHLRRMADGPHFINVVTEKDCFSSDNLTGAPDVAKCKPGTTATLFPSTSTYIRATVTDPKAKHWNSDKKEYVIGPLTTRVFYQFQGRHPDLNYNGVDDFVEIAQNPKMDRDKNGVVDNWKDAKRQSEIDLPKQMNEQPAIDRPQKEK